ncbi:MAG: hypothetical protein RLP44_07610 [Aggregatilineales bacterium]
MKKVEQVFVIRGDVDKQLVVTLDNGNSGSISNLVVLFEGRNVAYFADASGAKDGLSVDVPELGKLGLRINTGMFSKPKIFATLNGHILPTFKGKSAAPQKDEDAQLAEAQEYEKLTNAVRTGAYVMFFVSAISGIGGLIATMFQVEFLLAMGLNGFTICAGLIYFVIGYVAREVSWAGFTALVIGFLLYLADTVAMVALELGNVNFIRLIIMYLLLKACYSSWKLLQREPEVFESPLMKKAKI